MSTFLSILFIPVAQNNANGSSLPRWVLFLIILIILVAIIWYLTRPEKDKTGAVKTEAAPMEEPAVAATAVKTEETQPEPEPEPEPAQPDDLKKIEGIGPKIESILNAAGITTFAQLANASVADLNKIVRQDAGITIAFPDTWPKQAQMAADGNWDKLAVYQDELHGGRQIKK